MWAMGVRAALLLHLSSVSTPRTISSTVAKVERCSCILPFLALLVALSLPLSVCLVLSCLVLRSSVTLDELTSFRS